MKFVLLIGLLCVSSAAALNMDSPYARGTPTKRDTNAARMRRGLDPLPPIRRSPRSLKPRTSPPPCHWPSSAQGVISVSKTTDGSLKGYISKRLGSQNAYTLTTDLKIAQTFAFPLVDYNGAWIDITAVDGGPSPANPLLGAVGGPNGYDFGEAKLASTAYLAAVTHTNYNSPANFSAGTSMQSAGYDGPSESQIWELQCSSLEILAFWTNVDNTQNAPTLFYDPAVDYLGLADDIATFNSAFPNDGAFGVTFRFVPM